MNLAADLLVVASLVLLPSWLFLVLMPVPSRAYPPILVGVAVLALLTTAMAIFALALTGRIH